MLTPSSACLALIKKSEGLRLKAYPDPASGGAPWTIGYGSTGADIRAGLVWTVEQADARLTRDVTTFAQGVGRLIGSSKTTQHQFDAMTCLAYNIGLGNFSKSSVLANHKIGRYANAAAAFSLWNKAAGKVMAGLTTRRAAEAALYLA